MRWITSCAAVLNISPQQVQTVTTLLRKQEATVPFIVRYRGDMTGGLDEQQVLSIKRMMREDEAVNERRQAILRTLEKKEGVPAGVLALLRASTSLAELEDVYAPYKAGRSGTLADQARDNGHGPLADSVWGDTATNDALRRAQREPGVLHLLAERVSESVDARAALRELYWRQSSLTVAEAKKSAAASGTSSGKSGKGGKGGGSGGGGGERSSADSLAGTTWRVSQIASHRVLAINRAEARKEVRVSVTLPDRDRAIRALCASALPPSRSGARRALLEAAAADAFGRLLQPAMSRDVRRRLTAEAEAAAAAVFASNLRHVLLQRPVRGVAILGIDPGFRAGCKLACIDACGRVVDHGVVHPHPPQRERAAATRTLRALVERHGVRVIAIGDGTASQETCELVADAMNEAPAHIGGGVQLSVVSEAGASVYSVTDAAKKAEPSLDVGAIGAASLARRLQDPLAELVKIDPKAVGVGMYQHDVAPKALEEELAAAIESAVCRVGVDLNTASVPLLCRVPGLTHARAEAIVRARPAGGYGSRAALLAVKGVGPRSYEQAAGFLRLPSERAAEAGGDILDCTAVHPESYGAARALLGRLGMAPSALASAASRAELASAVQAATRAPAARADLAAACGVGERALAQIADALSGAERDAREELPGPLLLGTQLRTLEDLKVGQRLEGVVRNVTPFGCFINVGLKEDGLLHVSKMGRLAASAKDAAAGGGGQHGGGQHGGGQHGGGAAAATPREPSGAFVGQTLRVLVLSVDVQRRRLSLGLDTGGGAVGSGDGGGSASTAAPGRATSNQQASHKRKRSSDGDAGAVRARID